MRPISPLPPSLFPLLSAGRHPPPLYSRTPFLSLPPTPLALHASRPGLPLPGQVLASGRGWVNIYIPLSNAPRCSPPSHSLSEGGSAPAATPPLLLSFWVCVLAPDLLGRNRITLGSLSPLIFFSPLLHPLCPSLPRTPAPPGVQTKKDNPIVVLYRMPGGPPTSRHPPAPSSSRGGGEALPLCRTLEIGDAFQTLSPPSLSHAHALRTRPRHRQELAREPGSPCSLAAPLPPPPPFPPWSAPPPPLPPSQLPAPVPPL